MNIAFFSLLLGSSSVLQSPDAKFDSGIFGDLQARAIGPAVMGGRISSLDAVTRKGRLHIYVGAAGGGVWKSVNGGTTFKPVFDKHPQSIGAIRIDRSNPDIVWVGTGEPWTRNSVSIGTGVYKTKDAGENWELVGLKDTERVSKILINPTKSDTVYVCAPGHLWNSNEERGLFKTTDGGKTWEKILYVDADTGCADIAMDPQEPDILYAAMWQFRRRADFFTSGGPGSGLYKSADGGKSWHKITEGLPSGTLGRIAIAVAPSRPSVVYATVESEKTGMYRSDDLGERWRWVGSTDNVEARPFYFSLVVVDPTDHNRVYKPGTFLSVSTDGGQTFSGLGGGAHPDHHALWINPDNAEQLLLGTDGGVYVTGDRGVHWTFLQSLPVSQFYHVNFDMAEPYHVFGGLQDNGTWLAPSQSPGGIANRHWENIASGDGFYALVDCKDPDLFYTNWQGGRIERMRRSTGERKDIKPLPAEGDPRYRFNWNTPIHLSQNREDTVYVGGQFLFRSRDRGESWEKISPDLTTNDPAKQKQIESGGLTPDNSTAENHCTIYAISESPRNESVIWAGTDDGNIQVTRDSGKTWTNVTANVPNLPPCTWVSYVESSPHAESTAFATFDGHTQGDMKPYVYRTNDFGKSWTSLSGDAVEGYAHVIRQDLVNPDLLFLGTELGLYVSLDGGKQWARFEGNVPKVAVRDIAIHPREHDLILATHGRGILIVDDLTPLRQLTPALLSSDVAMLPSRPSVMRIPAQMQEFMGDAGFVGPNPPDGAQIAYYLKKRHILGDLKLEILDADGKQIAIMPGGKRRGVNRVSWSFRGKPPKVPPAATLVPNQYAFVGPQVSEGAYTVRLSKASDTYEGTFSTAFDKRAAYSAEERRVQDETVANLHGLLGRLTFLVDSLIDLQKQAKERVGRQGIAAETAGRLKKFDDDLEAFRKTLVATRKGGFIAGEEQLREELGDLYGSVNGHEGKPTSSQIRYAAVLGQRLLTAEAEFEKRVAGLDELNAKLASEKIDPLRCMSKDDWEKKQAGL